MIPSTRFPEEPISITGIIVRITKPDGIFLDCELGTLLSGRWEGARAVHSTTLVPKARVPKAKALHWASSERKRDGKIDWTPEDL